MSNDGIGVLLVFVEEVGHSRESYLVDIFVYLLLGHSDAVVADGQGSGLLVEGDAHGGVAYLALEVALGSQSLELLCGVYGVGYHLAQEDVVV